MKTAKELVYDAITHLRNKYSDIALSPIEETDNLKTDYGFEHKDECKLAEMISIDGEFQVGCVLIHKARNVKEVINIVQAAKTLPDQIEKMNFLDSLKVDDIVQEMKQALAFIRATQYLSNISLPVLDLVDNAMKMFLEMLIASTQEALLSDNFSEKYAESDLSVIKKNYTKELEFYHLLLKDLEHGQ
jgi:hypothetical protein